MNGRRLSQVISSTSSPYGRARDSFPSHFFPEEVDSWTYPDRRDPHVLLSSYLHPLARRGRARQSRLFYLPVAVKPPCFPNHHLRIGLPSCRHVLPSRNLIFLHQQRQRLQVQIEEPLVPEREPKQR